MKTVFMIAMLFLIVACTAIAEDATYYHNELADTCPKGMTDDPYPGSCGQYIDINDDGFCDKGQEEKILIE